MNTPKDRISALPVELRLKIIYYLDDHDRPLYLHKRHRERLSPWIHYDDNLTHLRLSTLSRSWRTLLLPIIYESANLTTIDVAKPWRPASVLAAFYKFIAVPFGHFCHNLIMPLIPPGWYPSSEAARTLWNIIISMRNVTHLTIYLALDTSLERACELNWTDCFDALDAMTAIVSFTLDEWHNPVAGNRFNQQSNLLHYLLGMHSVKRSRSIALSRFFLDQNSNALSSLRSYKNARHLTLTDLRYESEYQFTLPPNLETLTWQLMRKNGLSNGGEELARLGREAISSLKHLELDLTATIWGRGTLNSDLYWRNLRTLSLTLRAHGGVPLNYFCYAPCLTDLTLSSVMGPIELPHLVALLTPQDPDHTPIFPKLARLTLFDSINGTAQRSVVQTAYERTPDYQLIGLCHSRSIKLERYYDGIPFDGRAGGTDLLYNVISPLLRRR